jgi:hypothetical protein
MRQRQRGSSILKGQLWHPPGVEDARPRRRPSDPPRISCATLVSTYAAWPTDLDGKSELEHPITLLAEQVRLRERMTFRLLRLWRAASRQPLADKSAFMTHPTTGGRKRPPISPLCQAALDCGGLTWVGNALCSS